MARVDVVIFHQPPRDDDAPLVRVLAEARHRLVQHQVELFERAGAGRVRIVPGRVPGSSGVGDAAMAADARVAGATDARVAVTDSFGGHLAQLVGEQRLRRLVVFGSGAVPLLSLSDARRLVAAAGSPGRVALTNNRYSSDICAMSDASPLLDLPALPSDNPLPRWLEERAGFAVSELPARDRLAFDLDTPQDVALLALVRGTPRAVRSVAAEADLTVPRLGELRALARDPRRELLIFGRSGSATLRWLERNVRCRVRFLAEERGLRASSPLAIGDMPPSEPSGRPVHTRPPRATLGRLLADHGPGALASIVAELADGAIIDSRVLMADRFGSDEDAWPAPVDRFASDLLRPDDVTDPWLRDLTASAASASIPILLGAHTLVGPGVSIVLGSP